MVVSITVQNLVRIGAVVSIICLSKICGVANSCNQFEDVNHAIKMILCKNISR